jgi:hypothetical protein
MKTLLSILIFALAHVINFAGWVIAWLIFYPAMILWDLPKWTEYEPEPLYSKKHKLVTGYLWRNCFK